MNEKIDWVRKLTSRKFWLSIASFVSMLVVAFGASDNVAAQVTSIIMAGASVIGYVLGEGLADAGHQETKQFTYATSFWPELKDEDDDEEPVTTTTSD